MTIVSDADIQVHLPAEKFNISVEDYPDDLTKVKLDVERVVKGRLTGTFAPLTLASWSAPEATPETIRALGGRLAAALLYRLRLAEDYPDDIQYAQRKYREGMDMLEMIVEGSIVLLEVTEVVNTGRRLTQNNFTALPEPKFAMNKEF